MCIVPIIAAIAVFFAGSACSADSYWVPASSDEVFRFVNITWPGESSFHHEARRRAVRDSLFHIYWLSALETHGMSDARVPQELELYLTREGVPECALESVPLSLRPTSPIEYPMWPIERLLNETRGRQEQILEAERRVKFHLKELSSLTPDVRRRMVQSHQRAGMRHVAALRERFASNPERLSEAEAYIEAGGGSSWLISDEVRQSSSFSPDTTYSELDILGDFEDSLGSWLFKQKQIEMTLSPDRESRLTHSLDSLRRLLREMERDAARILPPCIEGQ